MRARTLFLAGVVAALAVSPALRAFSQDEKEQGLKPPREAGKTDEKPAEPGKLIDITVEDADLREVMDQIGRRIGKNIVVEPDIDEKVTISLVKIPWRDAVDVIAKMTRCGIVERGEILVVVRFQHGLKCSDCKNGLCSKHRDELSSGEACFVPLRDVEGKIGDEISYALEERDIELGVFEAIAAHRVTAEGVFLELAPGARLKLSSIERAIKKRRAAVETSRPLRGKLTLYVRGKSCEECATRVLDAVASVKGASSPSLGKAIYPVELGGGSSVALDPLRATLAQAKLELQDVELLGPAKK